MISCTSSSLDSAKKCTKCGESKPFTTQYFNKSKNTRSGLSQPCRECHKKRMSVSNKKRYAKNRDYWLMIEYQKIDKRLGYENDLDLEWFKENITSQPCTYCGTNTEPIGSDRLDNTKGHTKENTIPCCKICNKVRNNIFTHEEMKLLGQTISRIKADR